MNETPLGLPADERFGGFVVFGNWGKIGPLVATPVGSPSMESNRLPTRLSNCGSSARTT